MHIIICTKNEENEEQQYQVPWSLSGEESPCNAGESGSIPGLGRYTGEGNGNPLQYSCLENPMDRGTWQATAHGVARVGHNLASKPPPLSINLNNIVFPNS